MKCHVLFKSSFSIKVMKPEYSINLCKTATRKKKKKIGFQDQLHVSLNAGQKYCRMLQGDDFTEFSTAIFCHLLTLFLAIRLSCSSAILKISDKIMFHSIFRRVLVPEAFYRIRTLKGACGYSLIGVPRAKPLGGKMVSEYFTWLL